MRAIATVGLVLSLFSLTGCYLGHAALGQARLLLAREPIETAVQNARLAPELRARLELVTEVRAFATTLGLEVGARYTSFAAWPGDRVVTTVVATPPHSLEPVTHWFPITGSVPYLGFFDPARAEREAERQRARGNDVCVSAVVAYSTLGWLDDPVVEPMLRHGDGWLVETLLHELVHHTAWVPGDATWNEGLATYVGEEASVAFFAVRALKNGDTAAAEAERARVDDDRLVAARLTRLRQKIAALYADPSLDDGQRAESRTQIESEARAEIAQLPFARTNAGLMATRARLNDACLALDAAYTADLPRWHATAQQLGGLAPLIHAAKQCKGTDHVRGRTCPPAASAAALTPADR